MNMHTAPDAAAAHAATPTPTPAFATVPGVDYATDYAHDDADDIRLIDVPAMRTFIPGREAYAASRRQDGWSAEHQRTFLEAIAEGHGVDAAARRVGLSASSAYAFRRTAKGAAFALGWRAASLVARDALAETLLVRAMEGTVDTIVRGDSIVTRHRFDNRLALTLLARLDRQVEAAPDADVKAARLVAQEFDAYLDIVGRGEGAARAGLFLARRSGDLGTGKPGAANDDAPDLAPIFALAAADRLVRTGVATAGEVDIADLDPAARVGWTAEQWARAEAAGLLAIAAPKPRPAATGKAPVENTSPAAQLSQHWQFGNDDDDPVRWCDEDKEWRTSFAPPPGFDGEELGDFGEEDYERTLTDAELLLVERACAVEKAAHDLEEADLRDRFFALLAAAAAETPPADDPTEHAPARPVEPAHQSGHPS